MAMRHHSSGRHGDCADELEELSLPPPSLEEAKRAVAAPSAPPAAPLAAPAARAEPDVGDR